MCIKCDCLDLRKQLCSFDIEVEGFSSNYTVEALVCYECGEPYMDDQQVNIFLGMIRKRVKEDKDNL